MDKQLMRNRFARAASTYNRNADVQHRAARTMAGLIRRFVPQAQGGRVLEIGCGTGLFTRMLLQQLHPEHLLLNDICSEVEPLFSDLLGSRVSFRAGDAEILCFPGGQDLIASCSVLQWFDHPERFLHSCSELLSPGGCLAFSTFGPQTMQELSRLGVDSLDYRSEEQLLHTLSPDYRVLYSHTETLCLTFDSPLQVLQHLRHTGVTGIRRTAWTKGRLEHFCRSYQDQQDLPGGQVRLTYQPIYMICKKKLRDTENL